MKCSNPNCNAELYADDRFCGQCGQPLSTAGASGHNDEALAEAARALVRDGRKIEAVKLVKERLGCGLKEAKDYVEYL